MDFMVESLVHSIRYPFTFEAESRATPNLMLGVMRRVIMRSKRSWWMRSASDFKKRGSALSAYLGLPRMVGSQESKSEIQRESGSLGIASTTVEA